MASWSMAAVWRQLHTGLITVSGLLISFTTVVAALEAPISEVQQVSTEPRIAAYQRSPALLITPSLRTPTVIHESEVRGRITEARRVLMALHAFIEETARAVELQEHLKIRKIENDKLKGMLSSSLAAKEAFQTKTYPIEDMLSNLTGTVVGNWLDSIQLSYRSAEAERELIESEKSLSDVESQVAALRQTLIARRAELRSLRKQSAVLSDELNRMRRQVTRANAEARLFEQQRSDITGATETLRRNVTSELRKAILEGEQ
ncbi:MAG: hypothetical protein ACR2RF_15825 [Geminicoccaceae bacterium]